MRYQRYCLLIGLLTALALTGCTSGNKPSTAAYQTVAKDPHRDTELALKENNSALELILRNKYDDAEPILKRSLEADIMYAPAHNNLGKVYYQQGKMYLAAWEFQYAADLLPNQPEPRNNLGLVFEATGKLDQAIAAYEKAVTLAPDDAPIIGNLARAHVRHGDCDDQTRQLLAKLVARDTRPEWLTWARENLARLGPPPTTKPHEQ